MNTHVTQQNQSKTQLINNENNIAFNKKILIIWIGYIFRLLLSS
jgi:hypothetical protein